MAPSCPVRLLCESLEDRQLLAGNTVSEATLLSPTHYRPDQILVQFKTEVTPRAEAGTTLGPALSLVPRLYEVVLSPQTSIPQALQLYQANPAVELAQPDYLVTAERVPNDPLFNNQWAFVNRTSPAGTVKATTAWDTSVGSGQTIVAVIDTGVDYNHRDLTANMWRNPAEIPGNGRDDEGNGYVDDVYGYNFVRKTGNPMDDNGHGTHVAGILGAVGDNGVGVAGVNWNVKIMALKFMDATGHGSTSDALRALNYAVQMGATISNNSWTSPASDPLLEAGIRNAQAAGHIYVAAAGNSGQNLDVKKVYPAGLTPDNLVAVAALDSGNRLPSWSNWGPNTVKIAAPGSNIYSTLPGNRYGSMSGTSMATPFVAGAMALVRDLHPDWSYGQVIARVLSTADRLPNLVGKVGGGKLNIAAAVGTDSPPPPPTADTSGAKVVGIASLVSNNQIVGLRITLSEAIQSASFTTADVLSLVGPVGSLTPTAVTAVPASSTQFDLLFAGQAQTGNYSVTLGPDILDLAANPLNQNGNSVNGENPGDRYAGSVIYTSVPHYDAPGMPAALVDRGVASFTLVVPDSMSIGAARVQVNISHTWMSDLVIKLRSPAGTEILLVNRRGGAGKGYVNTIFDDQAILLLSQGSGTFTGSYRPENPLGALKGQRTNGAWTLVVQDLAGGDTGTIHGWSLTFDQAASGAALRAGAVVVARGLIKPREATPGIETAPRATLAPAVSLTRGLVPRAEVIRRQTQQFLATWQNATVASNPLLRQVSETLLNRLQEKG